MSATRAWFLLAGLMSVAVGCDATPTGGTVAGKVSFEGKPIKQGTVLFMPRGGMTVTGALQPDGTFKLVTPKKDEHIPLMEYKVVIITDESNMAQMSEDPMALKGVKPAIPLEFSSDATTPLKYEVKEGANTFDIVLDDHLRPL